MKRLILGLIAIVALGSAKAQDADFMKRQKMIFEKATYYNDPVVARMALYNMISMNPSNDNLLDSLAVFYFDYGQYASAAIVSKELQTRNPDNILAYELAAASFESLNIKDRALDEYESLFLKNNNSFTLYKIAFLQFELERYNESLTSADILLRRKEAEEQKILFNKTDKTQQEVPMKAALFNLKGIIYKEQGETDKAADFFDQAIEAAPDFELAQLNKKSLTEGE